MKKEIDIIQIKSIPNKLARYNTSMYFISRNFYQDLEDLRYDYGVTRF